MFLIPALVRAFQGKGVGESFPTITKSETRTRERSQGKGRDHPADPQPASPSTLSPGPSGRVPAGAILCVSTNLAASAAGLGLSGERSGGFRHSGRPRAEPVGPRHISPAQIIRQLWAGAGVCLCDSGGPRTGVRVLGGGTHL